MVCGARSKISTESRIAEFSEDREKQQEKNCSRSWGICMSSGRCHNCYQPEFQAILLFDQSAPYHLEWSAENSSKVKRRVFPSVRHWLFPMSRKMILWSGALELTDKSAWSRKRLPLSWAPRLSHRRTYRPACGGSPSWLKHVYRLRISIYPAVYPYPVHEDAPGRFSAFSLSGTFYPWKKRFLLIRWRLGGPSCDWTGV